MSDSPATNINHIFVLMLENHSFDNIFAFSNIPGIYVANTKDYNEYNQTKYYVNSNAPVSMPTDPGHEFTDVVEQLAGPNSKYPPHGRYPDINNEGFASNYATTTSEGPTPPSEDIGDIMSCFNTQTQLPVIYQLATEFAICDHWFSSLPGPTWPNRFFLHGASSSGLDHSPTNWQMGKWETLDGFEYENGSIFDALGEAKVPWRIYADIDDEFQGDFPDSGSIPQVAALKHIELWRDIYSLKRFEADLKKDYSYQYTFIEPNYGDIIGGSYANGSSQHPMDDIYGGEKLVKFVYETIRQSPVWKNSLLIITYDEHGGFYDSMKPGKAVSPGDKVNKHLNKFGFTFEQYGVRVPALVVSPYIARGTADHTVYDHTSVLATIERLCKVNNLTQRDANANDVLSLLTLSKPRTDCPEVLTNPAEFMQRIPVTLSAEEQAAIDLQPIPEEGSLPGFMYILLKSELELEGKTEEDRARIIERFKQLKTRGDARKYLNEVMGKVQAIRLALNRG